MNALIFLAQVTTPAAPTSQPAPAQDFLHSPLMPLALGMLVLFWFMSRSKKKQEGTRQQMLDKLKKGDRIQTIGGVLGSVVEVRDGEVVVKVDESNNTKMRFTRSAIHKVVEEEKSEAK